MQFGVRLSVEYISLCACLCVCVLRVYELCVCIRNFREAKLFISVVAYILFVHSYTFSWTNPCAFISFARTDSPLEFCNPPNYLACFVSNASNLLLLVLLLSIWRECVRPCVFIDFSLVYILMELKAIRNLCEFAHQKGFLLFKFKSNPDLQF